MATDTQGDNMARYTSIELFAGCGGLALGLHLSGISPLMLNDSDKHACNTLKLNCPNWNVVHNQLENVNFQQFKNVVDVVTGGFPCQPFSFAGKRLGFEDVRGTLFYDYAKAVKQINPKIIIAENVRGILNHNQGHTIKTIEDVISDLGYEVHIKLLKAVEHFVPQKRERVFIVGIRRDISPLAQFKWPEPNPKILTMRDAMFSGDLYDSNVPKSVGQEYSAKRREVLALVPPGGCWRHLPVELQKDYMQGSYYLSGGKTGMARRLSWDEPCLTLTCSPSQKQTERCHPEETRPLTVREYARVQTFPDYWQFSGPVTSQYKQIGNAVPVNLAIAVGNSIVKFLNTAND